MYMSVEMKKKDILIHKNMKIYIALHLQCRTSIKIKGVRNIFKRNNPFLFIDMLEY